MSGPEVALSPKLGLSLAMSVHELATNAVKYGPLSTTKGKVTVRWTTDADIFTFTWQESGGPEVTPPAHTGFGSRLVTQVLASEFDGTVALTFNPAGVICTLTCAASSLDAV